MSKKNEKMDLSLLKVLMIILRQALYTNRKEGREHFGHEIPEDVKDWDELNQYFRYLLKVLKKVQKEQLPVWIDNSDTAIKLTEFLADEEKEAKLQGREPIFAFESLQYDHERFCSYISDKKRIDDARSRNQE